MRALRIFMTLSGLAVFGVAGCQGYSNVCDISILGKYDSLKADYDAFKVRIATPPQDWYEQLLREEELERLEDVAYQLYFDTRNEPGLYCTRPGSSDYFDPGYSTYEIYWDLKYLVL